MTTYNGHKNWAQWNQSLWINNDEGLYNLARECVRMARTRRQAAEHMLAYLPDATPDGARYSLAGIMNAMRGM